MGPATTYRGVATKHFYLRGSIPLSVRFGLSLSPSPLQQNHNHKRRYGQGGLNDYGNITCSLSRLEKLRQKYEEEGSIETRSRIMIEAVSVSAQSVNGVAGEVSLATSGEFDRNVFYVQDIKT